MTLNQLVVRAASVFRNADVLDYWDRQRGAPAFNYTGKMLVQAVLEELTFDFDDKQSPDEAVAAAVMAMQRCADTFSDIAHALANLSRERECLGMECIPFAGDKAA